MSAQRRAPKGQRSGGEFVSNTNPESEVDLSDDSESGLPSELRAKLPGDTAATWLTIAPLMPESAYLAGGTALAVHLLHRVSRDLDFFLERHEDLEALAQAFESAGKVLFIVRSDDTIDCEFNATKVQVLEAATQRLLRPTQMVAGVRVASVDDIMATTLNVIIKRGALRDYFDLMSIETQRDLYLEEGMSLAIEKYQPAAPAAFVLNIAKAIGSFDDVEDDPGLPLTRTSIESYWQSRLREVNLALAAFGVG